MFQAKECMYKTMEERETAGHARVYSGDSSKGNVYWKAKR